VCATAGSQGFIQTSSGSINGFIWCSVTMGACQPVFLAKGQKDNVRPSPASGIPPECIILSSWGKTSIFPLVPMQSSAGDYASDAAEGRAAVACQVGGGMPKAADSWGAHKVALCLCCRSNA
jgi:hypothetical protein